MSDSDQSALGHDFEVLLRYAAEQKVMLTPKQRFVPVRHVRNMMEDFRGKEPHEEKVGDRIYKKRWEMEYPRFYFLDLLALSGEFLTITRGGRLAKGPNWQKFFEAPAEGRSFYLFCTFRAQFNVEAWFLRGGGFGERLEEKWSDVWSHLAEWKDGQSIKWNTWAAKEKRLQRLFHWSRVSIRGMRPPPALSQARPMSSSQGIKWGSNLDPYRTACVSLDSELTITLLRQLWPHKRFKTARE